MSGQEFATSDVLRLEVEAAPTGAVNELKNPNGELGGWGWITPTAGAAISGPIVGGVQSLRFEVTTAGAHYFTSELIRTTPGRYVGARLNMVGRPDSGITWKGRFVFLDAAGAVLSSGAQTAASGGVNIVLQVPGVAVPAGAAYVQLRMDVYRAGGNLSAGDRVTFNGAVLTTSTSSTALGSVRTNLFKLPSAEVAAPAGQVASAAGYGSTVVRSSGYAAHGTWSWKVTQDTYTYTFPAAIEIGIGGKGAAVTAGKTYTISGYARSILDDRGQANTYVEPVVVFYDAAGNSIGSVSLYSGAARPTTNDPAVPTRFSGTFTVPSGVVGISLVVGAGYRAQGHGIYVDSILLEAGNAPAGAYFDGSLPAAGTTTYAWTGTAHLSTSTETKPGELPYIEPVTWLSVVGTATQLTIDRTELDASELTALFTDANLDPAKSTVLRPGRANRITVQTPAGSWVPLFTGTDRHARVTYDLKAADATKRARIELRATDAATELANVGRPDGFATIAELPAVLEGAGVPWEVNGSGDQVTGAVVVSRNSNASALDQVAVTRDSVRGYAWIDQRNVVRAYDRASMSTTLAGTLDESSYTDLDIDYDTDRCINHVTITFLRPATLAGEDSEEITYGPYVDQTSIDEWGPHAATFTYQAAVEDAAAIKAHATAILAANATPAVRVNSLRVTIKRPDQLNDAAGSKVALLDLYDLVRVKNTDAGIDQQLRVRGVKHTITARRWTLDLDFAADTSVATPSNPPRTDTGTELTIGQVLRPVGEITMWYGTVAKVPAGWLVCDGSAFSSTTYPALAALLGATTTPDMRDRVPVGVSASKALAATGGSETITAAMLPPHSHTFSVTSAATTTVGGTSIRVNDVAGVGGGTGTTGTATTGNGAGTSAVKRDPWRALYFIIRAR